MNIISILGIVLLVIAAAAGVVGYFKANLSQATILLYKEDNEALRARVNTLETQRAADKAQKVLDDARILALENANKYLGSVITQAEQIEYLRKTVDRIAEKIGA